MKCKNKKQIINKYYILLFLLLVALIVLNFNWIKNDERPINCEDEILLGQSALLYSKNLHGLELYKKILDLNYPPFIPSLIYASFKIFGPLDDSAFYINLFFWPVLVLSCFFLGKKLYNEKTGLLAAFIISTLPPVIIFSRTAYDQFILVSLIMLNLALFAYSDYFRNRIFSLLYGLSFALCLLTRYTSLPYIIVPPLFFIFFKKGIIKKPVFKNFMGSMIIAFITTMIWYINKTIYIINMYFLQFTKFTSENILGTIDNIFYYLIFLINYQLGFLNFLILAFVIIFLSIKYYKQRKIDEQDILLFLLFLIPYIFYTLIPLKNGTVTTSLLIPLSFIIARGILESPKIIKVIFLVIVVAGGLFYLAPIQSFNRTISIDLGAPLWVQKSFDADIIQTQNINLFSKKEDISSDFSKDSRFYALKNQQQIKEISKIISTILNTKNSTEAKIFFLYNNIYIYPNVLNYYLNLMNTSSSVYSCFSPTFYDGLNISTNLSYDPNQEKDFDWVYNFDFLIAPVLNEKIKPYCKSNSDYYAIYSYLSNSEKFKKNFKLIYQSNVSDEEVVQLYERKKT